MENTKRKWRGKKSVNITAQARYSEVLWTLQHPIIHTEPSERRVAGLVGAWGGGGGGWGGTKGCHRHYNINLSTMLSTHIGSTQWQLDFPQETSLLSSEKNFPQETSLECEKHLPQETSLLSSDKNTFHRKHHFSRVRKTLSTGNITSLEWEKHFPQETSLLSSEKNTFHRKHHLSWVRKTLETYVCFLANPSHTSPPPPQQQQKKEEKTLPKQTFKCFLISLKQKRERRGTRTQKLYFTRIVV